MRERCIAIAIRPRQVAEVGDPAACHVQEVADSASFAIDPGVGSIGCAFAGPNHELVAAIVDLVVKARGHVCAGAGCAELDRH